MKKSFLLTLVLIVTVSTFNMCKSSKSLQKATEDEEVEIPFTDSKYATNKDVFRATQSGRSHNLTKAKNIALINAKKLLASNVKSIIKICTYNYTNERTFGDKQEFENKFKELSRQVTNQQLSDVKVIDEKAFREQDGKYTYWVAIEMPGDALLDQISESISKEKKIKLDFDKHQYEKIMQEEMEKFENK